VRGPVRWMVFLLACSLGWSIGSQAADNSRVAVFIYSDVRVPSETLNRAQHQVAKVFARAGVDIMWFNCTVHATIGSQPRCEPVDHPNSLILRITDHAATATSDSAFGVAFLGAGGIGQYGDVFWNRVEELRSRSGVDDGAVLGSVLAHEMGHLLLGSNAHSISGIMKPRWNAAELRAIAEGSLMFLPEQEQRMRERIPEARMVSQALKR